jgi:hypothetical protein
MSWLSTVKAVALEGTALLLPFSVLDLGYTDELVSIGQLDGISLGILELGYACLCALSSLSETSGTAQVHRDWGVIEASRGVRGIITLEAALIIPLLSLFWDESSHLVIVSPPEDLTYGLLGDDAIDRSLL